MTVLYVLMLWVAVSFFLAGLWILYLEVGRWWIERRSSIRESAPTRSFMRRETLP